MEERGSPEVIAVTKKAPLIKLVIVRMLEFSLPRIS